MTCIVGLVSGKYVYIAADSLGSGNGVKQQYKTPKLQRLELLERDGLLRAKIAMGIGYTTSYRMGDILRYVFEPPVIDVAEDENEYLVKQFIPELITCFDEHAYTKSKEGVKTGGNFLVALRGRLFHVQDDFSVLEPEMGYTAIGSGQEFALGSLYSNKSEVASMKVEEAVLAASTFSTTVGGKVDYIVV